jgi:hypothetical protein
MISGVSGQGIENVLRAMAAVIRQARHAPRGKPQMGWVP